MKIAISGSSGLVGRNLTRFLHGKGYAIVRLVRRAPSAADELFWNPENELLDPGALRDIDVIINLSGESIASGRWTKAKKEKILHSRVSATKTLCKTVLAMDRPPQVLINASAIGYYGSSEGIEVDESSPPGAGFLAEVCRQWEEPLITLDQTPVRVVIVRTGVVLSTEGGALQKMLFPFKLSLGGVLGSGNQYMSWIGMEDLLRVFLHAIKASSLKGPINAVASHPVMNKEFTKCLGKVLHRPAILPMPACILRFILGEMADEMLLSGAKVLPRKLEESGFVFNFPTLELFLEHILASS